MNDFIFYAILILSAFLIVEICFAAGKNSRTINILFTFGILLFIGGFLLVMKNNSDLYKELESTKEAKNSAFFEGIEYAKNNIELTYVDYTNGNFEITIDGDSHWYKFDNENKIIELKPLGNFHLTAYCPCSICCGKWAGGNTFSGTKPTANRTIAVDPNIIPIGSKVMIDNIIYVAEDTGSGIKGNDIDIFFDRHSDAENFGVQDKEVFLVINSPA